MEELISSKHIRHIVAEKHKKHSVTFIYMMMLIVYFPILFYLRNFGEEMAVGYIAPVLFLLVADIYLLVQLYNKRYLLDNASKILLLLFFFALLTSFCVMRSGFERILGLLSILMSLLLFQVCPIKKSEWRTLYICFLIAVIIVLIDNILDSNINTNTSGFLLSMVFCVSLTRYWHEKNKYCLVVPIACIALQVLFASRTAMAGSILFLLIALLVRKKHLSRKTIFRILVTLAVLGILVAWFYSEVLFPNIGRGELVIFGKDLFTGRENIWHFIFISIAENFWFGVGSHINENLILSGYNEIYSNAHNQPIGILASFGIFCFVLFYIAFAHIISNTSRTKKPLSSIPAVFMMVIAVMCFLETYFFVQVQWLAVVMSYGLICGKCGDKTK